MRIVDHFNPLHAALARDHRRQRVLGIFLRHLDRRIGDRARRHHVVVEPNGVLVGTGVGQQRDHAGQRVWTFLVCGVEHAGRASDTNQRGDRGANARPHQVHVLEEGHHLRPHRELLFNTQLFDHLRGQAQGLDRRVLAHFSGHHA